MSRTGELIGPYTLGACLGQGGFGAVYEATHQETGQRVALKFLRESTLLEAEVQNRFVREIALLQRLEHENIVKHFDAGLHEGSIYCAMELVDCGTLEDVLKVRGDLPWQEAAEVALQVCFALDHAHQRGCVHRDLKPANLYLSEDGKVKLGDLGLARDLDGSRLTTSGQTVGTWRYMPPEQIRGEAEIDGRLDLYALGCILFRMIAGRVPFDGPDFARIFDQHLEAVPPRLDSLAASCPVSLADLVDEMLAKKPEDRPDSAAIVAERLKAILDESAAKSVAHPVDSEDLSSSHENQPKNPNLTQRLHYGSEPTDSKKVNLRALALLAAGMVLAIVVVLALWGRN
ncbi:MAG: serine/threonine protein kinase [Planctomycetales bacterium]|nr:serine/threonine protein kinase [Planctomycetales bacterium]